MKIKVSFDVDVPDLPGLTNDEITDWIRFSFRDTGQISENRLQEYVGDAEPVFGSFDWS